MHSKWTKEEVFEESKKYSSRKAFSVGNESAYRIACRNKWLDEMSWLVRKFQGVWTKEEVFETLKDLYSSFVFNHDRFIVMDIKNQ